MIYEMRGRAERYFCSMRRTIADRELRVAAAAAAAAAAACSSAHITFSNIVEKQAQAVTCGKMNRETVSFSAFVACLWKL